MMRLHWLVAGILAVGVTSGCLDRSPGGNEPAKAPERYFGFAGVVSETGNNLAVAVVGSRVRAFVCDAQDELWFDGEASKNGMVTFQNPKNKQRLGFFNTLEGVGAYWFNGRLRTFRAAPVDKPAGLYRAQSPNGQLVGGWVVLPEGEQVGAVTNNGINQPVVPNIDTSTTTVTINGQQLALKSGQELLSGG
ncbi:hypothetical protein [Actinomadura sp. 6N118]|uniref:hypothetical protein n=1 Tax=Actinomadura sp. 6N118 TaxID=3375151 RepID=UPI0037BA48C3